MRKIKNKRQTDRLGKNVLVLQKSVKCDESKPRFYQFFTHLDDDETMIFTQNPQKRVIFFGHFLKFFAKSARIQKKAPLEQKKLF